MKSFIVNLFTPSSHDIPHFRVGLEHIPGQPLRNWSRDLAANCQHLFVVKRFLERGEQFGSSAASNAAAKGYIEIVRELHNYGVHCTMFGLRAVAVPRSQDHGRVLGSNGRVWIWQNHTTE